MHPHLGAGHHQGIAHVVAGVPHIGQPYPLQMTEVFPDRQEIRQHLGRMELIGKPVPHRHIGILRQLLHDILPESPVFDSLEHARQDPGRVRDALLLADLGARRIQVGRPHPQVVGRHLKGASGAGAGLLEDQRHVLPPQGVHRNPFFLLLL